MKKKLLIIVFGFIMLGAIATLALYKIGDIFLNSAFEAIMSEQHNSAWANSTQTDPSPASPDNSDSNVSSPTLSQPNQEQDTEPTPSDNTMQTTPAEPTGDPTPSVKPTGETASPVIPSGNAAPPVQETPKEKQPGTSPVQETPKNEQQVYSPEQITDISTSVTASDKITASFLVLSKLSAEDITYLYGLLEGGLTAEEKAAAKELCFARFTDKEVELIYELYKKYTQSASGPS